MLIRLAFECNSEARTPRYLQCVICSGLLCLCVCVCIQAVYLCLSASVPSCLCASAPQFPCASVSVCLCVSVSLCRYVSVSVRLCDSVSLCLCASVSQRPRASMSPLTQRLCIVSSVFVCMWIGRGNTRSLCNLDRPKGTPNGGSCTIRSGAPAHHIFRFVGALPFALRCHVARARIAFSMVRGGL